jgi:hypothetical protein
MPMEGKKYVHLPSTVYRSIEGYTVRTANSRIT